MNIKIKIVFFLTTAIIFFMQSFVYARTTVTSHLLGTGKLTLQGIDDTIDEADKFFNRYGSGLVNAHLLANQRGYAVGVPDLAYKDVMFGLSVNSGMANMGYFDKTKEHDLGELPGVALNPTFNFGFGITDRTCFIGKFFLYSSDIYRPPVDHDILTLETFKICSVGGKFRYQAVKKRNVLPGIFNFGGISLGTGADFMYGKINFSGEYIHDYDANIDISIGNYNLGKDVTVPVHLDTIYHGKYNWLMVSGSVDALIQGEFFWIFNLYTGFSFSLNTGRLSLDVNADGVVTTTYADYLALFPNPVDHVLAKTEQKHSPAYIKSYYILGMDVNFYLFNISFESMVDLHNKQDVSAQIAFRFQI